MQDHELEHHNNIACTLTHCMAKKFLYSLDTQFHYIEPKPI
nr:MAG TPA: hypothetical protein [Ackermannviridae sp.]